MAHTPGYLQRRGKRFRVRLCVGGRRFSYTLRTADRREAERFARDKQAELERQFDRQAHGFAGPTRMSELLDRFEREELPTKSRGCQEAYADSLKPIRCYFVTELGDPTLDRLRAADVQAFLMWRRCHRVHSHERDEGTTVVEMVTGMVSNRTLQKDRAVLHAIFALADLLELRDGNPVARVPAPKADTRDPVILSDEQYEGLLAACDDPMLQLYALTLGETGMRCESEALWLRWEDVDLDAGFLKVESGRDGHRTKSGKSRSIPVTPPLEKALRAHFAAHRLACRSDWVFHHDRTRRHYQAGARIQSLRDGVMAAAKRAKLPAGWHLHDLRHRRVTTWLAAGKDVVKVKKAVGHADLRTTMDYTHLVREDLRVLVAEAPTPDRAASI